MHSIVDSYEDDFCCEECYEIYNEPFNKKFGKLYTIEQLEKCKKDGTKPYPANEEIKEYFSYKTRRL